MPSQSWKVDFDGPMRHIVAETDPLSGRVSIRVDGRMAAKPMAPEEDERTFNVGSVTYVIRRVGEELDLDIAPTQAQPYVPPSPPKAAQPAKDAAPKPFPVFKAITGIILGIVLTVGARYGQRVYTYMTVPWRSYTHPDRMFRVKFVGVPMRHSFTVPTPDGPLPALQLKSQHAEHLYLLEYIDLPEDVPPEAEAEVTKNVLASIVEASQWKVLTQGWDARGMAFIAEVPASDEGTEGTVRGSVIVRRARVYVHYAFVPRGESLSFDVGEFLRSLELAD